MSFWKAPLPAVVESSNMRCKLAPSRAHWPRATRGPLWVSAFKAILQCIWVLQAPSPESLACMVEATGWQGAGIMFERSQAAAVSLKPPSFCCDVQRHRRLYLRGLHLK